MTFDQIPDASYRPKGEPDRPEVRAYLAQVDRGLWDVPKAASDERSS